MDRIPQKLALALPKNIRVLEQFVCQVLRLDAVSHVEITPRGVRIQRSVPEDEPIIPTSLRAYAEGLEPLDPDFAFLLQHIAISELTFEPERHVLHTLMQLFVGMEQKGLRTVAIYVCAGDTLAAGLGLPVGERPTALFGIPVVYVPEGLEPGRVLLVGSPTSFIVDAIAGVFADLGGAV